MITFRLIQIKKGLTVFQVANLLESILVLSEAAYCALCNHCIHFSQRM